MPPSTGLLEDDKGKGNDEAQIRSSLMPARARFPITRLLNLENAKSLQVIWGCAWHFDGRWGPCTCLSPDS